MYLGMSERTQGIERLLDGASDARSGAQDLELVAIIGNERDVFGRLGVCHFLARG